MRILITGGAGFIGSHLGVYCLQKNHEVIFLDDLSFGYVENLKNEKALKTNFIKMDIRDSKINNVMKGVDIVYHFAGITSLPECQINPKKAYDVNVSGTANVIEYARRNNVKKIIFSSTSAIYENETTFPTLESANPRPTLVYSLSKKHAEEICKSFQKLYEMDIVILRFFNVYGPHMDFRRQNPPLISYIIKCLLKNESPILHSNGKQARDMIYVDDVINLCEMMITNEKTKEKIFNVGSGKSYTVQVIYNGVMKAFNKKEVIPRYRTAKLYWELYPKLFKGKYQLQSKFLEKEVNKYTLADITKANKLLNWRPKVSLEEGLKRTVKFAIKNR